MSNHPKRFWNNPENQRHFLEDFGQSIGITHPKDWGSVSVRQIEQKGGGNLFWIHGRSLFHILRKVFPGSYLLSTHHLLAKKRIGKVTGL